MRTKEDFRIMEREYNTWLSKHPKGSHNYKSFSHMRRSIEFAKYYNDKQVKKLIIPDVVECYLFEGKDKPTPLNWLLNDKFKIVKGSSYTLPNITIRQCASWIGEYVKKYYY
jgi:hypothetical protein